MNRQGNLNEFLDISAGNGTYAPRQRQAYQSKRLQQVISDFRKRQKTGSPTPDRAKSRPANNERSDSGSSTSGSEEQPPTKKQKGKTTVAGGGGHSSKGMGKVGPSKSRRGRKAASRGRGLGGAGAQKGRKLDTENDDSGISDGKDDSFVPVDASDFVVEREVNLRPRPKPRPRYKGATQGDSISVLIEGNGEPAGSPSA